MSMDKKIDHEALQRWLEECRERQAAAMVSSAAHRKHDLFMLRFYRGWMILGTLAAITMIVGTWVLTHSWTITLGLIVLVCFVEFGCFARDARQRLLDEIEAQDREWEN